MTTCESVFAFGYSLCSWPR